VSKKEREDYLAVFNALDTDNSGSLTEAEFTAGAEKFFGNGLEPA